MCVFLHFLYDIPLALFLSDLTFIPLAAFKGLFVCFLLTLPNNDSDDFRILYVSGISCLACTNHYIITCVLTSHS